MFSASFFLLITFYCFLHQSRWSTCKCHSTAYVNPFSQVIEDGDIEQFQQLLESSGHDPDLLDAINNGSLLITATENNNFRIVEMLLQHGLDPNYREPLFNETALFKSSFKGFYEITNLLIQYGANVSMTIKKRL